MEVVNVLSVKQDSKDNFIIQKSNELYDADQGLNNFITGYHWQESLISNEHTTQLLSSSVS